MTTVVERPTDQGDTRALVPSYMSVETRNAYFKFCSYETFDVWELTEVWAHGLECPLKQFATRAAAQAELDITGRRSCAYKIRMIESRALPCQRVKVDGEVIGHNFKLDGRPGTRTFTRTVKRVRPGEDVDGGAIGKMYGDIKIGGRTVLVEFDGGTGGDSWHAVALLSDHKGGRHDRTNTHD